METDIPTAFNDWNPRKHHWSGNTMVWEVVLCGSSKLVGDVAQPWHPHLEVPVVCFWLKRWGEGDLHRGWITAYEPALSGSRPPDPLDLCDEGLTWPFGYWGHSVSLGLLIHTPDELSCPFETWAILPQVGIHFLHLQTRNLNENLSGLCELPCSCLQTSHYCDGPNVSALYLAGATGNKMHVTVPAFAAHNSKLFFFYINLVLFYLF